MMRILIDGDIIKYRVGFASQHTYYWVEDIRFDDAKTANAYIKEHGLSLENRTPEIEVDPIDHCLHSVKVVMQRIQDKYPHGQMEVYFSCPTEDNWRTQFYPEYKANRKDMRRPEHYEAIGDYMEHMYPCNRGKTTEADDEIAIRAAMLRGNSEFVVVTIDKDMDQIEGLHYNWVNDEEYEIGEIEARRAVAIQAIAGDSTDNIKGIPKWGPAAAQVWLEQCPLDNPFDITLAAYREVYDEVEALYRATLNTALVSLPVNTRQIKDWTEEVNETQAAFESTQEVEV